MRSIAGAESNLLQDRHQTQPRFRISQDLPPTISRHIIPVTEPEDIFKDFQTRRERNYHLLIRRFIYQILYGCTNPACTTPTCLCYQKRTTKTPLRKLTPLSARTLACYLASESNPEAALCPHCPRIFPDHESEPVVRRRPRTKSHNVTFESSEKGAEVICKDKVTENGRLHTPDIRKSRPGVLVNPIRRTSSLDDGGPRIHNRHVNDGWVDPSLREESESRPLRDPKSFTQSLFETLPLRMLEWLPFQGRRDNYVQIQSSPEWGATRDDAHGRQPEKDPRVATTENLDQITSSLASEKARRRTVSQTFSKSSVKDFYTLLNGDAHPTANRQAKDSNGELQDTNRSADSLSSSFSTSESRIFSHQRTPLSDVSAEQGEDINSKKFPKQESHRHNNSTHDVHSSHQDSDQASLKNETASAKVLDWERNRALPTYTLERIPRDAFTDLRKIQAKLEELCLGYHLKEQRPWPDGPKPVEDLALLYSDWNDFTKQCCFYLLKDSSRLARAFAWNSFTGEIVHTLTWPTSILSLKALEIFGFLYRLRPPEEILYFLSYSLDQVFLSTDELKRPIGSQKKRDHIGPRSSAEKQYVLPKTSGLSNNQAAFICAVVLYALARLTAIRHQCRHPGHDDLCWANFCTLRSTGRILPADFVAQLEEANEPDCHFTHLRSLTDIFGNEIALELVSKLAKAISNRSTFSEISNNRRKPESLKKRHSVLQLLMQHVKEFTGRDGYPSSEPRPPPFSLATLEWLRTIVLRDWDGQPIIRRAGAVGGAIQMLTAMYENRSNLHLDTETFHTPFFADRLDSMEMPVEWLSYRSDNKSFHLLSHSFLFPPSALVTYFRAMNFATMSRSFETALITSRHVSQFAYSDYIQIPSDVQLLTRMRPAMATYLVLNVRRSSVLTDAMNQLWRRQKRELMRPLKVRMGMDEGEEGVDHGGVQQEFFRCLFAEALTPAYGMFTIDERTRMTWFQPCSLEPLYKFEMLGILFSIAVYNSITLPVTFPLAFYRKLLDLPVKKLAHIQDGWADLAKGLQDLLDWSDGDVGDVFMRTYEFSFEAFGQHISVDMQRVSRNDPWPNPDGPSIPEKPRRESTEHPSKPSQDPQNSTATSPHPSPTFPSSDPALVTNTNRSRFVHDYIHWLTTKSIEPQFTAFARGFYTCLSPTALCIFTPEALQSVIEGSQTIDIDQLRAVTKYEDGYTEHTPIIQDFWDVVSKYDDGRKRGLLEFVTASERIPVSGLGSVVFIVQRAGDDDKRLPTSMTCFGRLLLPQYSGRGVLEEKLGKAIENSMGFGVA